MTLAVFISVVFAAVLGVASYLLRRAYRRLAALQDEMRRLTRDLEAANDELSALLAEVTGSRIIIEIVNPMNLARQRSRWAAALVGVAPRTIRRRVYDDVARQMKAQLAASGVQAHLQVFHPTGA